MDVSTKLGKTDWMNFTEGITANMFVNLAILGYMLLKEESAKIFIALSAIFMFVFLVNEHLIANFASFMLLGFNGVRDEASLSESLSTCRLATVSSHMIQLWQAVRF